MQIKLHVYCLLLVLICVQEKLDSNLMRDFQLVSMTADSISLTEKVLGLSYIKFMTLDLKADLQLTQTGDLTEEIVSSSTVNSFKNNLDLHFNSRMLI